MKRKYTETTTKYKSMTHCFRGFVLFTYGLPYAGRGHKNFLAYFSNLSSILVFFQVPGPCNAFFLAQNWTEH